MVVSPLCFELKSLTKDYESRMMSDFTVSVVHPICRSRFEVCHAFDGITRQEGPLFSKECVYDTYNSMQVRKYQKRIIVKLRMIG
jgi:hypothetical protein